VLAHASNMNERIATASAVPGGHELAYLGIYHAMSALVCAYINKGFCLKGFVFVTPSK